MARKLRVYELAKHYGVESPTIMAILRQMKAEAKSHMSVVEDDAVDRIHARFQRERELARLNYARAHGLDPEKLKHVASLRELPRPEPAAEEEKAPETVQEGAGQEDARQEQDRHHQEGRHAHGRDEGEGQDARARRDVGRRAVGGARHEGRQEARATFAGAAPPPPRAGAARDRRGPEFAGPGVRGDDRRRGAGHAGGSAPAPPVGGRAGRGCAETPAVERRDRVG